MSLLDLADRALAAAPIATHYRWRVMPPDGDAIEVCFRPELSRREVAARYPGAMVEPLPDVALPAPAANDEDDPGAARRRSRALAILAERPEQRIAVVAESGEPAHVTVAIRDIAVGDLEVSKERFDGFALLGLMQQYGNA